MSEEVPTLNLHRGKSWTEWTKMAGSQSYMSVITEKVKREVHPSVCLLPRKDILLYGCCPKMDVRVLCQCNICGKVMMPSAFLTHSKDKHGPDQSQTPTPVVTQGTSSIKKKHSHTKTNKKKIILPPPVPPPPLFPRQATPPPNPVSAAADLAPPVLLPIQVTKPATPPPTTLPSPANGVSKHKKSKKSSKKVKEYDPDKHCGVVEGHKGPCLRSITCSNHMVLLRKAVPGRSKDFQQLIADHKAAKDKETSKQNPLPSLPKLDTSTTTSQNATFRNVAPVFVKITQTSQPLTTTLTTNSDIQVLMQPPQVKVASAAFINANSQGNLENCSSVVYMPMSPIAVISPVQFVQLEGPILRVASTQPLLSPPIGTQPIVVTIPVQNNNTPMYTTHPKPLILSTCSTRKIGATFVLQNQRIDRQRSEIQTAANTRRSIANSCSVLNTHHHKPNILKNSVRASNIKINAVRRQAADKLVNDAKANVLKNSTRGSNIKVSAVKRQAADSIVNDTKQIRLNDVNGFILHADVSEGAEAPQPNNNSVHDKITFINMK